MSFEERLKLLENLQQQSFIQGIDKGTLLERDTKFKIQQAKKKAVRRKFYDLIDEINDYINIGVKRNKRKKYKGRYHYPKKKSSTTKKLQPTFEYKPNLPPWLKR